MLSKMTSHLGRLVAEKRGSIAILSGVFMTVAMGMSALAIDMGLLYLERRHAQGAVDLAAIAAAASMDTAESMAQRTLSANGVERINRLDVIRGRYMANPAIAPDQRFTPGGAPYNAVRVSLTKPGQTYFSKVLGWPDPTIAVQGMAASAEYATFSIGSRLAALRGGLANRLLEALVGGSVSLSVMDYEALANANIEVVPLLDQLATDLNLQAGTYQDVLDSTVSVGQVVKAMAATGSDGGAASALLALDSMAGSWTRTLTLAKVIDIGSLARLSTHSQSAGLAGAVDALTILRASAMVANGSHQVELAIASDIPGVASLRLQLAVGEPPVVSTWISSGPVASTVRTAQLRLKLVAEFAPLSGLSGVKLRLPVMVETAWAEAKLGGIECGADQSVDSVRVDARPGIVEAWIGDTTAAGFVDFARPMPVSPAALVMTKLISARGTAHAMIGETAPTPLYFSAEDIETQQIKRTSTEQFIAPLVTSLLGDLDLEVNVLGLALLAPSVVTAGITQAIADAATPLDALITGILRELGVSLGEADVKVHSAKCGRATLSG